MDPQSALTLTSIVCGILAVECVGFFYLTPQLLIGSLLVFVTMMMIGSHILIKIDRTRLWNQKLQKLIQILFGIGLFTAFFMAIFLLLFTAVHHHSLYIEEILKRKWDRHQSRMRESVSKLMQIGG